MTEPVVRITATRTYDEWFASREDIASMTDAEIVELVREDVVEMLDSASWTVERL